jgi:hypothetical protein
VPNDSANDPRDPVSRPASSREIYSPPQQDEVDGLDIVNDSRPQLALPKKRPLIMWIGIALLLGALIALILSAMMSD